MPFKQFLFLFLLSFFELIPLKTAGEVTMMERMEHADSRERILSFCIYFDSNMPGKNLKEFDAKLAVCYRIAERDQDKNFKAYLDFYNRVKAVLVVTGDEGYRKAQVLKIWEQVLNYYKSIGDERFTAICNAYIGHYFFIEKEYTNSLEQLLIANEGFKNVGYDKFPDMGKHLHNMALVFYFFRQYEKVAELMEVSTRLPVYDTNKHIQRHYTLGAAYTYLHEYDKAERAFIKTRETAAFYNDPLWIGIASRGLAKVYLEQGRYADALHLYESTLNAVKEVKRITGNLYDREYSEHLLGLVKTCIFLKEYDKAQLYLDSVCYKANSDRKEQSFIFGITYQNINYWLEFYDVQRQYHYALKHYEKAFHYSDSLYLIKHKIDSTFNGLEVQVAQNRIEAQDKQNQNDKKEATIKSKNQQLVFIVILLSVIVVSTILIIRRNRQINSQNKVINKQLGELTKTVEQKQVLLSELQHRVKNNLQHVISILDIQKESADFNNIDELIRGNQNRIHSMALLHKKLNISDNVNDVNFDKYIIELAELVKDSYESHKKTISLEIKCSVEKMSIEKALPVGLILTELISNSMKYAFRKKDAGTVHIEIEEQENSQKNKLSYSDNGSGFDFNKSNEKGLGMEIIRGLIDQLDGTIEINSNNGFKLTSYFS